MIRALRHITKIIGIIRSVPGYQAIIVLQLVSSMTSFLGIPLLIPTLGYVNNQPAGENEAFQKWVELFFGYLDIPVTFNVLLITISILVISSLSLNIFTNILIHYIHHNRLAECSKKLLRGYLDVKWHWLVSHHSGEISHALYNETAEWSGTAFSALKILVSLFQFMTFFVLALYISFYGTVIFGAAFSVIMVFNVINAQFIKRSSFRKNELQKDYAAFANSIQQNKKFLKASLLHDSITRNFSKILDRVIVYGKRIACLQQLQSWWIQCLVFLLLVSIIAFYKNLHISFESLAVLLLVFMRLMPQMNVLADDYSMFNKSLPVYDSMEKRLADLHDHREAFGKRPYVDGSSFRLREVGFSYNKKNEVLRGVSLDIPSRSTVAVVGGSGGGKSTVLDLFLGLWEPSSGRLFYGALTHRELDYATLRKRTAYVSQETTLFSGSLRDNLVIGNPSATDEEVERVCKMVCLDGLIRDLPDGLGTGIGENGIQLSGGQRQRVALGRALLMNPDVLILDEATSSLDLESEKIIQEAVNALHNNLTIIIVAHRLSTVKGADYIYVLERGEVCESGTFDQLISQKGRFSSLYSMQMAGVMSEKEI